MTSFRWIHNTSLALALISSLAQGCTRPKQTTAIGSGVGGAVGAGLGAIVGNQTGSAGAGVAIGAVAGAATGALIGNALQAQQETTRAHDEALKRQERLLQAQRNEIAELRSLKSDSSYTSNATTPRYRYRQMSVDMNSPEVEKRRTALQRRGPQPRGASHTFQATTPPYLFSRSDPATSVQPTSPHASNNHITSSDSQSARSTLARFDVRGESRQELKEPTPSKATLQKNATESKPAESKKIKSDAHKDAQAISDVKPPDLEPIIESEPPARAVQPAADSPKCKEANSERELATQAPENSDKLFHLRRALRLCPSSAALHFELGKIYAAMERTNNAEEEFKQALALDPSMTAAKTNLSELLKNETRF